MDDGLNAPSFDTQLAQGQVNFTALLNRIKAEFPKLGFVEARLNDLGEGHAVVILDDAWVFRFPRTSEYAARGEGERRLLKRLRDQISVPVPNYDLVSATGDFAGYPMIHGVQLTETVFTTAPQSVQEELLRELGGFLSGLHALPASLLSGTDHLRPRLWRGSDYARRYHERRARFANITGHIPISRVDAFFAAFPEIVDVEPNALIHDDLTSDHILLAPNGRGLGGVIDFSDAGYGDAARDFAFFWTYGVWAPDIVADAYSEMEDRARLLLRSRWWFLRFSIERLWWHFETTRASCDVVKVRGDILQTLDALGL